MIHRVSAAEPRLLTLAVRRFGGGGTGAAAFTATPGTIAFVAADGDDVQGWCWGYLLPRPDGTSMLYLHNLEVAPQHRRRGVGRGLLSAFLQAGVRAGARTMFLITGEHNTAARRLYESMGAGLATQGPTVNYWFVLPATE
ncbi:GNAT family N-acetyltransferase [Paractinoplanes atraurantiacus]|uniref:Acetyltransferase (GNAT) family protein n=1 Tax=Paractinoplanes atraurantiacus TaxID=1036182 RepID=A0A285IX06_9ACTN|nr:GNAT family N-acetyltransferase [Actinoplanes atraurantiacus]SNY52575.1 Acetyltransferase (GNAT) family protein [Actinoplanes atraurantiacus]